MRLSELYGKEMVDFRKAERLGILGQTDLEIDQHSGEIKHLLIPMGRWIRRTDGELKVPWSFIRTIGTDMIILEVPEEK